MPLKASASDGPSFEEVKRELSGLMRSLHKQGGSMPCPEGITPVEAVTLSAALLLKNKDCEIRPSELAKCGHTTPSALSQNLKSLEAKGLIFRERDQQNFRSVVISLTEEGERVAEEVARLRNAYWDDLLDYLGKDDVLDFLRIMRKMLAFQEERSR